MLTFSEDFTSLDSIYVPGETPATPKTCWVLQARNASRAVLVPGGGLKLTTMPGDSEIAGSANELRADVFQCVPGTADPVVHRTGSLWVSHDVDFTEMQYTKGASYIVFDFHNTGPSHAASYQISLGNWNQPSWAWGLLQLQRSYGNPDKPTTLSHVIGEVQRKTVRFLHQIRWSEKSDGYCRLWVDGVQLVSDGGPTLYPGQGVYLKLANYFDSKANVPSSVIHKRIRMGTTRASVL